MEPITWSVVAGLLLKYGPELTEYIIRKVQGGGPVTPEEWAEVSAILKQDSHSQLADALLRNGIDPASPQAKALFALLQPKV